MYDMNTPTPARFICFFFRASPAHSLARSCDALHKQRAGQPQRAATRASKEAHVAVRAAGARLGAHSGIPRFLCE